MPHEWIGIPVAIQQFEESPGRRHTLPFFGRVIIAQ
jgi:hypothetical protein